MERVFVVIACVVGMTSAWFWDSDDEPEWDGLRAKFSMNPFSSSTLAYLPRTVDDAVKDDWKKIADCDSASKFQGARYVKDDDYGVILLFDVNGYIAGIQCGIPQTDDYPPSKQIGHIFQQDDKGEGLALTAYFTNPAKICSTGRNEAEFSVEGTGTGLFIQNGSDPFTQSTQIAMEENSVDPVWKHGFCFWGMGEHYWHGVTEDMDCADFQPVFLLYNDKKLNAFGWALGLDRSSDRWEHPRFDMVGKFMNPVAQCLKNYPKLSTMHIYLTDSPRFNFC